MKSKEGFITMNRKKTRMMLSLLMIVLIMLLAGCGKTVYNSKYISKLDGGYLDTLDKVLEECGTTKDIFQSLIRKHASQMSEEERTLMNNIRAKQIVPTKDTLMQKVITVYDMNKYLSGEYKTPKGFVYVCADVKHLTTVKELYEGLALNYEGSLFSAEDPSIAVIRFQADNIDTAIIPRSVSNNGTFTDGLPFGGTGFSTGSVTTLGVPEWVLPDFAVLSDGAQLIEITQDGTETLRGTYDSEQNRFIAAE